MMKKLKAFSVFIVTMLFAVMASVAAGAAPKVYNGISVNNDELKVGDDFYVYVDIPEITNYTANAISLKVGFDNDAFEVLEIHAGEVRTTDYVAAKTDITSKATANEYGMFAFAVASDTNTIDLSDSFRFYARLRVLKAADKPSYSFDLETASVSYLNDLSKKDTTTIWGDKLTNSQKEVTVNVSTTENPGASHEGGIKAYPDEAYYGDTVRVSLTIPAMPANYGTADSVAINVKYEPSVFRFIDDSITSSPDLVKKNLYCSNTSGLLTVQKRNKGYPAYFNEPITIEAKFRVISKTKGNNTFKLSPTVYYEDSVGNKIYMWEPKTEKSTYDVYINTRYGDPTDPSYYDPAYWYDHYDEYQYWLYRSGISLSSYNTKPGEQFYVYVTVPDTYLYDNAAYLRVNYDANEFELDSSSSLIYGGYLDRGYGYFTISSLNWYQTYKSNRGYTFSVPMRVRSGAKSGSFRFSLTNSDIYYWYNGVYNYQNLWAPEYHYASMTVSAYSSSSWNNDNWTYSPLSTPAQTTRNQPPAETQAPSVTRTNVTEPIKSQPNDDDDDTTRPASSYGTIGDTTRSEDDDYFSNDDDDDYFSNDDDDDDYYDNGRDVLPDPGRNAKVSIDQDLNGLSRGLIGVSTKSSYFPGNTVIVMRNTADASASALSALRAIGLGNSSYYAFDISLYNEETGRYYHDLLNGSIEFRVPVPKSLASAADRLSVYHTPAGIAEYIPSELIHEDGVDKLVFSASSFSPYVFVDALGNGGGNYVPSSSSQSNYTGDGMITPSGSVDPFDGNVNPHTGVTAAILIPTALTGCVILARKSKKHRKRAKQKYPED